MGSRVVVKVCVVSLVVVATGALGACTGNDAVLCNGSQCVNGAADRAFELMGTPAITLVQGGVAQVEVAVTRAGVDGPIQVDAVNLPPGVAVTPLVIPAGATSGTIALSALPNVAQGTRPITIRATELDGKIRRERATPLLVRGPPGSLDTTFGNAGRVSGKVGVTGIAVRGVATQSDGRILVTGSSERDVVVVRLDLDGAFDAAYGAQGKVTADLRVSGVSSDDLAEAIAVAPNGNAVIAGWTTNPTSNYAVARFSSAGALDLTFDRAGYVVTPFAPQPTWNGDVLALAVVVQPDGKPVFGGTVLEMGAKHHPVIARFKTTGALDDTFGTGDSGWFFRQAYTGAAPLDASDDECTALALSPGDKIVGAGTTEQGGKRIFAVRLDGKGKLDTSFGSGGFAQVAFPFDATAQSVHTLPDGRVLVTGTADAKMMVTRLDANGLLDTQYGGTGKVIIDTGAPVAPSSVRSALDGAGRIVLSAATGPDNDVVIARVLASGQVDASFGTAGHVVTKLGAKGAAGNIRIALEPDGRIIAVTSVDALPAPELAALRFWP